MLSVEPRPFENVEQRTPILQAAKTILSLLLWLCLSSAVVLSNKWLLSSDKFPFPVTLAFLHMLFCSCVGIFAVHLHWVQAQKVTWTVFTQVCLPVAVLGAAGLIFANASFLFLSIAFAQMLKANMPVLIYIVGCIFRTHSFDWATTGIMLIIGFGVATSSAGEIRISGLGSVFTLLSMLAEAFKMTLLQSLMRQADLHIDPINALYYIMPASAMCLMHLKQTASSAYSPELLENSEFSHSLQKSLLSNLVWNWSDNWGVLATVFIRIKLPCHIR